ncbi:hypothetical protein Ahy_A09g043316 [Arachis hypogaea]|uniref:Ubiquitin-like protease family profile domain-containing protein n=1 Tax=Arachis hypogaea TaxID=3818 RepID=A0A445BI70_ARAHY|nr:hypothetical protein Ahy_A09g043316 [Arachis hypogaea]
MLCLQQTKDLKCATYLLSEKFRNMSEEKKTIVRDLGFGGLMHIPKLWVHHQILRELANSFKLGKNRLETGYSSFKVRPKTIGAALGINALGDLFPQKVNYKNLSEDNKQIFRRFQDKKRAERPPEPWIANWTTEQLVERMRAEMDEILMESRKRKKIQEDSDSESESNDESEIGTQELEEILMESRKKKNNEKFVALGEKEADLRSTEAHMSHMKHVNLGSDDPWSQGHTDQSRVPIQICLPISQTTIVAEIEQTPVIENEPTLLLEIEGTTKSTPEPPQKPEESTPVVPPAPSKINPAPEDTIALIMMARTASYVPKIDPLPSFSLGFTDSSQEEATTQEGAATQDGERVKTPETPKLLEQLGDLVEKITSGGVTTKGKSPEIQKESGGESFEKFETHARTNEDTSDMKEKCYIRAIRVKTYANGLINEFDTVCTLQAQDKYILSKVHLASLAAETHIEAEIVSAMCLILNQQKIKRFQKEVYCLPHNIVVRVGYTNFGCIFCIPSGSICLGAPLKTRDKDKEIEPPYLNISGQKTSYDCAIYVMKWLEIIQPENIKRLKYEWDNWTQDEVDYFRVEYASRILFHEMNQNKAEAIRGSNAIRLSKPSSLLLSPYCQIDSNDI